MIVYDLKCQCGHAFEAWFRDSESFDSQIADGEVSCPLCGSGKIAKALMAPRITGRHGEDRPAAHPEAARPAMGQCLVEEAISRLREHVINTCDYVGERFADEARRIHYGEAEERGIYGEATRKEAEELKDEGVAIAPLPFVVRHDA